MSTVSPDEPEAQTCGDAFNNAWQCYCASRPSRPHRPPIATTEKISARPDPEPHLTDAPTSTPSRAAPTFQMTRYYRYGELDSCEGRWDAIWACMDSRKRSGQGLSQGAGRPTKRRNAPSRSTSWTRGEISATPQMRVDTRRAPQCIPPPRPACLAHVDEPRCPTAGSRSAGGNGWGQGPDGEELAERDRAQSTDTKPSWFW